MKKLLVIGIAAIALGASGFFGYYKFVALPEKVSVEEAAEDDGEMKPVERSQMAFVDPPMFTVTTGQGKDMLLLNAAIRIAVPPDQAADMRRRISIIQDSVNVSIYQYLNALPSSAAPDYRLLKRKITQNLRTRLGAQNIHGVLYHMVYIR